LQVQLYGVASIYAARDLHLSEADVGLALFTLNGVIVVALQLHAALYIQRVGIRRALIVGSVGYAVGTAAFGLAQGQLTLMVCVAAVTLCEIVTSPAQQAMATVMAPEGRIGAYTGLYGLAAIAGQSLGPLIGTALLDSIPARLTWPALALLGVVAAFGYRGLRRV
jgi:MFS family permease